MVNKVRLRGKRFLAMILSTAIVVGSLGSIPGSEVQAETQNENVFADLNSGFEGAEADGVPYWWYGSEASLKVVPANDAPEGSSCVEVSTNNVGKYIGCATNATSVLEDGEEYGYSFWAKLGEDCAGTGADQVSAVISRIYETVNFTSDQDTPVMQEEGTLSSSVWTKVEGSFAIDYNGGSKPAKEMHFILNLNGIGTFYVDDLKVYKKSGGGENILDNPDFEDGTNGWYASAASSDTKLISVSANDGFEVPSGSHCVRISDRTENWNSVVQNITDKVENNATYDVSFWVRLDDAYQEDVEVQLCTTKKDSNDGAEQYDKLEMTDSSVMASKDEWRQVKATLKVAYTGTLEKLEFKIAEQKHTLAGGGFGDFYVDNVKMIKQKEGPVLPIQKDIGSFKGHLEQADALAGNAGVAVPLSALNDERRMELIATHYNSITAENEMKPDSFLGQSPAFKTVSGNDGEEVITTDDGDKILQLDFTQADQMMDWVLQHNTENPADKIGVRGHVLVWHSQTPDWFFREGYDSTNGYVDSETMLERMENYIKDVMEHYEGTDTEPSKYAGVIYEWDVVNEQIEPADYDATSNPYAIRTHMNGEETGYGAIFKDKNGTASDEYIIKAFEYANKYAPADIKLYYNDYGETSPVKRDAIVKLIERIQENQDARIDAMGMQGHYNMDAPSIGELEAAIRAYADVVGEVHITELDLQSSNDYDGTDKNKEYTKQAYRYKAIFDLFYDLDKEHDIDVSGVTMWGTHDGSSWLNDVSWVGGGAGEKKPQCPLLFDNDYQAKPAYYAIIGDMTQVEPFIDTAIALYNKDGFFEAAEAVSFSGGEFKTIWNEDGIKIWVDAEEGMRTVKVYLDADSERTTDATIEVFEGTIADGSTVVTIPASSLGDIKIADKIAMDVVAYNQNGDSYVWNDLTKNQANSSKYYGEITYKPYAEITKGSAVVDGEMDESWDGAKDIALTIQSGAVEAESTFKAMWDNENLYIYAVVKDANLDATSTQAHEHDSVEIFLDQNNGKTDSYEDDDCQYRINYFNNRSFNGVNCKEENITSAVKLTNEGYIVEAAIKLTHLTPKEGDFLGLEFQINDGKNGGRIGSASWYDEKGTGWSSPSVFGTVKLAKAAGGTNPGTPDPKPEPKPDPKPDPKPEQPVIDTKKTYKSGKNSYKLQKDSKGNFTAQYISGDKKAKNIAIPATIKVDGKNYPVTSVKANAFKNYAVEKVTIGSNVASIGNKAFYNCKKLKTVSNKSKVLKTVGNSAFQNCTSLKNITFHAKLQKIGKKAFYNCKKLSKVTIKSNDLKSVGSQAFKKTKQNLKIKVPSKKVNSYKRLLKGKGQAAGAKVTK